MTFSSSPFFTFSTTFDSVVGFSRTLSTSAVTIVSAVAVVVNAPNPKTVAVAAPITFFILTSIIFFEFYQIPPLK